MDLDHAKDWARRDRNQHLQEIDVLVRKGAGPTGSGGAGGGEGSRGGHVIGHLKSGKAVYESKGHTDARGLVAHVEEKHHDMSADDHDSAAALHRKLGMQSSAGSHERNYHEAHARAHEMVGANKALASHFGGSAAGGLSHGIDHSAGGLTSDYSRERAHRTGTGIPPEHHERDQQVSAEAHAATAKLRANGGSAEEHTNAAGLHGAAANVARAAGDHTKGLEHDQLAVAHTQLANKGGGKGHPTIDREPTSGPGSTLLGFGGGAGKRDPFGKTPGGADYSRGGKVPPAHAAANQMVSRDAARATARLSNVHGTAEQHTEAAGLHAAAANVERDVGNEHRADYHKDMAAQHEAFAKQGGGKFYSDHDHTKGTGIDQAEAMRSRQSHGNPAREGIEAAKSDDAEREKLRAAGKPLPPSLTGMHKGLPGGGLGANYSLSPSQKAEKARRGAPPEQNPVSKVRQKLAGGKAEGALKFGEHKAAEKAHKQAEEHAAAGNHRSAAVHASSAANTVSQTMAGNPSKRDHELAAALHERAAGHNEKATKPQTAHVHKEMAAAHRLGAKAEASGKASDHDKAFSAFDSATTQDHTKRAVASMMSHHRAKAQRG
jgi:hypothetical protein